MIEKKKIPTRSAARGELASVYVASQLYISSFLRRTIETLGEQMRSIYINLEGEATTETTIRKIKQQMMGPC